MFLQLITVQCSKDLATEPRCKSWTNGPGQVVLGFQKVKQEDEGGGQLLGVGGDCLLRISCFWMGLEVNYCQWSVIYLLLDLNP